MANNVQSSTPRWYMLWRRGLFAAAGLLVVSLVFSILVTLALRSITPATQIPSWIQTLARWGIIVWFGGTILGLLLLLAGTVLMLRQGRKQGISWRRFGIAGTALVGVALVSIGGLAVEGNAAVPFILSDLTTTECSYQITAIVFEDRNNNGSFDLNESGIAGVKVTAQHAVSPVAMPKQDMRTTDVSGAAQFVSMAYNCHYNDRISVSAELPAGYSATSPLAYGPFAVYEYPKSPVPQTVYFGVRKN